MQVILVLPEVTLICCRVTIVAPDKLRRISPGLAINLQGQC